MEDELLDHYFLNSTTVVDGAHELYLAINKACVVADRQGLGISYHGCRERVAMPPAENCNSG